MCKTKFSNNNPWYRQWLEVLITIINSSYCISQLLTLQQNPEREKRQFIWTHTFTGLDLSLCSSIISSVNWGTQQSAIEEVYSPHGG